MANNVESTPAAYVGITPYLRVKGGVQAMAFYKEAFGAEEMMRLVDPQGRLGHGEMKLSGGLFMLSDEYPEWNITGPASLGGTGVGLMVYVEDVDAAFARAVAAGAKVIMAVQDQFYGDRTGKLLDPFGHEWTLATHIEDVSPDEIELRMKKQCGG